MSTKLKIVSFLDNQFGWVSGTQLEGQSREWQTKASVISRRARELANDGLIQRRIWERGTVQYKSKGGSY